MWLYCYSFDTLYEDLQRFRIHSDAKKRRKSSPLTSIGFEHYLWQDVRQWQSRRNKVRFYLPVICSVLMCSILLATPYYVYLEATVVAVCYRVWVVLREIIYQEHSAARTLVEAHRQHTRLQVVVVAINWEIQDTPQGQAGGLGLCLKVCRQGAVSNDIPRDRLSTTSILLFRWFLTALCQPT